MPDNQYENTTDFEVILASYGDDGSIIATSPASITQQKLLAALSSYNPKNSKYSAYLNEGASPSESLTVQEINDLCTNPQNNLLKVQKINAYNRKLINKNDIVGKTVESIDTNINTEIKLTYTKIESGRNKKKKFTDASTLIDDFNESINIKKITRNSVTTAYIEGNWIAYLRHENPENYKVNVYPLGVCEISDYDRDGDPIVLFNISELRNRLTKSYKKNKKNKALFFETIEDEVKANYPQEVYDAFIAKEKYAILDPNYTGVIRINNLNRKYGVSPILRAYTDLSTLETFADSDRINSKAKGKKIIHQKMRVECMGTDFQKDFFPELAYAHDNFMSAWAQPTVVVTSPPTVESISYVEPKVEMTNKDTHNIYRSKVLSTLGIQFLMDSGSQSVSSASISVTQLMRTINSITEQLESILKKWYCQILIDHGYSVEYAPDITVIDSEQMETKLKIEMATFMHNVLNVSLDTCFKTVGLNVDDEAEKRRQEKENGYDELFTPRSTAYTNTGGVTNNSGGRPSNDNEQTEGKRDYDKTYNKEAR